MGLKSSQMGGIVCAAWIRLLGIPGNVEGEVRLASRKGCLSCTRIFLFLLQTLTFLLRYYFCLLPTSIKSLRQLAIKDSHVYT